MRYEAIEGALFWHAADPWTERVLRAPHPQAGQIRYNTMCGRRVLPVAVDSAGQVRVWEDMSPQCANCVRVVAETERETERVRVK